MDERSTLQFRSNIYPISTKGLLINDRRFLASIYDPEALDLLWHHNGSHGALLTSLQKRQHNAAKHCMHAEDGDFPWGTPVGSDRVICLCEKTDCPRFGECMDPQSGGKGPTILRDRVPTRTAKASGPPDRQKTGPSSHEEKAGKSRSTKQNAVFTKSWSEEEKRKLREAYFNCKREDLYRLFPHRSPADVDLQIDRMRLASSSQPRRPKQSQIVRATGSNRSDASRNPPSQKPAKKKPTKAKPNLKPWTVSEDVLIRRNYPRYGSNIERWSEKPFGRSASEIEKRADVLRLTYKPKGRRS